MMKVISIILCASILMILPPQFGQPAQLDQELDEVLDGFDDEEKPDDELQEIFEGFEDESPAADDDEETNEDEILDGFEDDDEETPAAVTEDISLPSFLSIDGYLKLSTVYAFWAHEAAGTDTSWHGLTRLRPEIKLIVDADLPQNWQARVSGHAFYDLAYTIQGRNNFTDDVLDSYETEIMLDEVYLLGSLTRDLDIKAGRQIVVWGRSDNIRIADVLNPLDLRWPGLVDIEKLRLPVTMTKLDYYFKGWNLNGIVLHEVRYNMNPEFGSDFFPASQPLPSAESPDEGFAVENTQFAASLNGIFRGWDVSFYYADIYAQNGYLRTTSLAPLTQSEIKHPRIQMLGGAFNITWRNWLFKTEAAFFDGFEFSNTPDKTYSRLDALAGVEYSGLSDATIALEIANRHYFDFDERLEAGPDFQKEDLFEWALRITKPYWHDTLNLTFVTNIFGWDGGNGGFQRFAAEYDLTDSIELTGGVVFYQSGDLRRILGIGDNDRVFCEVQYNF